MQVARLQVIYYYISAMDSMIVLYILGAVCLFVLVVLVASGLENIIKIILGNYILGSICFAANLALDSLIVSLGGLTGTTFISISATTRSAFLRNGQMTIIVVFYILLLIKSVAPLQFSTDYLI